MSAPDAGRTLSPRALLAEWFHEGNEDGCDCIKGLPGLLLCEEWAENIIDTLHGAGLLLMPFSAFDPYQRTTDTTGFSTTPKEKP